MCTNTCKKQWIMEIALPLLKLQSRPIMTRWTSRLRQSIKKMKCWGIREIGTEINKGLSLRLWIHFRRMSKRELIRLIYWLILSMIIIWTSGMTLLRLKVTLRGWKRPTQAREQAALSQERRWIAFWKSGPTRMYTLMKTWKSIRLSSGLVLKSSRSNLRMKKEVNQLYLAAESRDTKPKFRDWKTCICLNKKPSKAPLLMSNSRKIKKLKCWTWD